MINEEIRSMVEDEDEGVLNEIKILPSDFFTTNEATLKPNTIQCHYHSA